jgi:hypothetical protein
VKEEKDLEALPSIFGHQAKITGIHFQESYRRPGQQERGC